MPRNAPVIAAAAVGAGVGALTVYCDRPWWSSAEVRFGDRPQFLTYVVVFSVQVAIAAAVVVLVLHTLRDLWVYRARNGRQILGSGALLAALAGVALTAAHARLPTYPFAHHEAKEDFGTVLVAVPALLAAAGMLLVQVAVERTVAAEAGPSAEQIMRFADLRGRLQLLLTCLGAILGAAILAAGAHRNAILAGRPDATYPTEWLLVYGGVLSGLVVLAYAPVHARVVGLGRRLRDRFVPMPAADGAQWANWYADRAALEELLGLQVTAMASLRTGAAILTPLAGSIVGLFMGAAP